MKKRFSALRYLNPKNLATEVHRYGYNFSIGTYLRNVLLVYGGIIGMSWAFLLQAKYVAMIIVFASVLMPLMVLNTYRNMYEERKFDDLTNYMEQMLYSFKRRNKVLSSLEDTLALFPDGEMHDCILRAIDYIQNSSTTGDIYREALGCIEEVYGCKRLSTMHNFLADIENSGGEYETSIDILLGDRKLWIDRIYALKQEKKNIRIKITIGIVLSFLVGLTAVRIVPEELAVFDILASQIVTTFVFFINMLIYYISNKMLSKSMIQENQEMSESKLKKKYELVFYSDLSAKKKKAYIMGAAFVPVIIVIYFFLGAGAAIVLGILAAAIATQPARRYKTAFKQIRQEVEKAFPDWLMSMSLLLQTDNVHVALSKSIGDAPLVLKHELAELEKGIVSYPNSVEPYIQFFQKLDIPDVQSAMKMLYSMAEFGVKDINVQIGTLVERNSIMTDRAERLRAEDQMAGLGFFVLAPMITGVMKLVTDMALIIFSMLSIVNTL